VRTKLLRVLAHLKAAKMHLDEARRIWSCYGGCFMNADDFHASNHEMTAVTLKVKAVYAEQVFEALPAAKPTPEAP
jgi:hypothetical protein